MWDVQDVSFTTIWEYVGTSLVRSPTGTVSTISSSLLSGIGVRLYSSAISIASELYILQEKKEYLGYKAEKR